MRPLVPPIPSALHSDITTTRDDSFPVTKLNKLLSGHAKVVIKKSTRADFDDEDQSRTVLLAAQRCFSQTEQTVILNTFTQNKKRNKHLRDGFSNHHIPAAEFTESKVVLILMLVSENASDITENAGMGFVEYPSVHRSDTMDRCTAAWQYAATSQLA